MNQSFRKVYQIQPQGPRGRRLTVHGVHLERESYITRRQQLPPFVLLGNSSLHKRLHMFRGLLLLYTSVVTPLILAYNQAWGSSFSKLEVTGYVINALYFILILVKLRTTFKDSSGAIISDWWGIAKNQLKGWLILDLVSLIPTIHGMTIYFEFSILRVLHLLFQESPFGPDEKSMYKFLNRFIVESEGKIVRARKIMVYLHVLVCGWIFVGHSQLPDSGWIFTYCRYDSEPALYVLSLYFVLTSVTTIGFGDIVPTNQIQRIYVSILMQIGGVGYAVIVGNIIGIIRDKGQAQLEKNEKLSYMKKVGSLLQMPSSFRNTINKIVSNKIDNQYGAIKDYLKALPLHLRGQLSYQYHKGFISEIPYLDKLTDHCFVGQLCLNLTQTIIPAGQLIFHKATLAQEMYLMKAGIVAVNIIFNGDVRKKLQLSEGIFGHVDMVLSDKRRYEFYAVTDLVLYKLKRVDYQRIYKYQFVNEGKKLIAQVFQRREEFNQELKQHMSTKEITEIKNQEELMRHSRENFQLVEVIRSVQILTNKVESLIKENEE